MLGGALLSGAPPRLLAYAALFAAVGAGAWRLWVLPRALAGGASVGPTAARARRTAASAGALGGGAGLLAALWLLAAQAATLADPEAGAPPLGILVGGTAWGRTWALQAVALAGAAAAYLGARAAERRGRPGAGWWRAGLACGVAATALQVGLGHAAADGRALAWGAAAVHAVGGAVWLGTLGVLVATWAAHRAPVGEAAPHAVATVAALVRAFSPLALAAAATTGAAGAVQGWLRLEGAGPSAAARLTALGTTAYGRLLVAKTLCVLAVAALGAVNWRRRSRRVDGMVGVRALDRTARLELAAGAAVLAVTAALSITSPPGAE